MVRVRPDSPTGSSNAPTRAAARAAQRRRRQLALVSVVVVLAVALAIALSAVFARELSGEPGEDAASAGGCLPSALRITADPIVAGALESVVADLTGSRTDCPDVLIRSEDSSVTAAALSDGSASAFDVWVPDSAMWAARVNRQAELTGAETPALVAGPTVASTPVVFAASESTAAGLEADGAGFASLATGSVAALLPDPSAVGASSAALLGLQTAVGGDARTFTALVLALDTGVVPTAADALAAASAAKTPTIAVTTEQAVQEYSEESGETLVSVHPADVQPSVAVSLVTDADASDDVLESVEALTEALADSGDRLAEHGLRAASGSALDADGSETPDAAADPMDSDNQAEALRTWQVLTAPSRMLSLNDVSGSMLEPATPQLRRIDLFEQAAVAAVNALSSDSSLATWVFSSRRIGGQDWQEIVPFGPLSDPEHKQRTIDTANGLDSLVGGGTGLYDSVLAAVTYMRQTYVPGQVNLVLLNTDGVNEDDEGLDLPGLLTELDALHDPARPVAVIAIGYGPDTDQAALEQIAAATDGAAYQALEPTDILTVLVDAVTQRGCRPYCG